MKAVRIEVKLPALRIGDKAYHLDKSTGAIIWTMWLFHILFS